MLHKSVPKKKVVRKIMWLFIFFALAFLHSAQSSETCLCACLDLPLTTFQNDTSCDKCDTTCKAFCPSRFASSCGTAPNSWKGIWDSNTTNCKDDSQCCCMSGSLEISQNNSGYSYKVPVLGNCDRKNAE